MGLRTHWPLAKLGPAKVSSYPCTEPPDDPRGPECCAPRTLGGQALAEAQSLSSCHLCGALGHKREKLARPIPTPGFGAHVSLAQKNVPVRVDGKDATKNQDN